MNPTQLQLVLSCLMTHQDIVRADVSRFGKLAVIVKVRMALREAGMTRKR